MKGEDKKLVSVMDGSDSRFVIPVYQRNYDWRKENCKQLFSDLLNVVEKNKESHFFGSIVSSSEGSSHIIIDGQQRLTTVSILLIALKKLIEDEAIPYEYERLAEKITKTYLTDEYSEDERKMKLKPVKNDMIAFDKLFGDPSDFDYASNVTQNYLYFYDAIKDSGVLADDLLEAIKKLVVIDITLHSYDDPQLIFESLNSTGMDLSEADKIRNFVLMGQPQKIQEALYDKYWNKIEVNTGYNVSEFIRQYLTLKNRKWPTMSVVYKAFKEYAEEEKILMEDLLADMLKFSSIYRQIQQADTGNKDIDKILQRLARLDMSVANPYLFALLNRYESGALSAEDTQYTLLAIESYIFRRLVCDVPTNTLNKIFATLNKDVEKVISNEDEYADAVVYVLQHKVGSGRFPDDKEFSDKVGTRDFYHMQQKNKIYYFDRLENGDSREYLDVAKLMLADKDGLSVEHVMPQSLSEHWKRSLGDGAEQIHEEWKNRIANLTLTAYNSRYSNRSFTEKLNMENGFKESPLPLNKWIAQQEKWGLEELKTRNGLMKKLFLRLWSYPITDFEPEVTNKLEYGLDEEFDFTGTAIASYTLLGSKHQVDSWKSAAEGILYQACELDPAAVRALVDLEEFPGTYLGIEKDEGAWRNIGHGIYAWLDSSTKTKIRLIEEVFSAIGLEPEDLSFEIYPQDDESEE